jgi:hypothetical protein
MRFVGLDPGLLMNNNGHKERKQDKVTNDGERKIVDRSFVEMSKRDGANREQKYVRKKKRQTSCYDDLSYAGARNFQTGGR